MSGVVAHDGVRVRRERCDTCIFHPGNRMHLTSGRVASMVAECRKTQSFIPCHETLETWTGERNTEAICRGFYDAHGGVSQLIRIAERLGAIVEVDAAP